MDTNSNEKKPKRPRIGQPFRAPEEGNDGNLNNTGYKPRTPEADGEGEGDGFRPKRPYQPRQGGYNNGPHQQRPYNNYNNHDGENNEYQPRPYQPRQQRPYTNYNNGQRQQRPYNNYNNQGGYNNGERQQRPYNNQGGYNKRPYNNNYNNQGGYNNNGERQQRPYNNQGGYNKRPYNNQGGYNKRPYNNRPQGDGSFQARGKSFTPRPKRVEYEVEIPDPNEQIRLNKYMSNAGICSRREADEFIQQGLVKVNGQVVTELGTKITHNDVVEYDEKVVTLQSKCYILLNKPKDCVTTSDDPNGRLTVMDLVKGACNERIYPVGRLDRNTTGVLLLTNDGDLASKLTHPKFVKKKIYHVWCDRDISEDDMQRIADGIELDDGPIHADAISYATETDRNQAGIEIHSGRNRIVRRIFESLGYHVVKLDRVYFAGLTKKNLPRGRWRYLTQEEVNYLKMGSFE